MPTFSKGELLYTCVDLGFANEWSEVQIATGRVKDTVLGPEVYIHNLTDGGSYWEMARNLHTMKG